ncbi:hypothetical protein DFH07DRAFT_983139 [Mycena maculata]|uniref:Uncharacterized protein n=1 Tax=Mycena maculata TaxID=230809 RepID=A0AAD7K0R4_9AGAR|nr:hypothetical protein DFH07DRAFT_983139 [Mycena maculata]
MARKHLISFISALSIVLASVSCVQSQVFHIPSTIQDGTAQAQFTSCETGLDAPKVRPINESAFDWWYYDVASADPSDLSSVVVTFFTSSQPAFPFLDPADTVTIANLWVLFPNGTLWAAAADGDGATVIADGKTSSGMWLGMGFSWTSHHSSGYHIEINVLDVDVTGTITFPPVRAGQNLEVGPHVGWVNTIPDAAAVVSLNIGGTLLAFAGTGYHNKNWSDQVFAAHVASWYWGHGRVGPYSIVWFDFLDKTGTESVSAYVAKDGKIVAASCTLGSITVRPTGQNATYPPVLSTPNPTGYHIAIDLGEEGTLAVDVTVLTTLITVNPEYARSIGNVSGTLMPASGAPTMGLTGMALFMTVLWFQGPSPNF